METLMSNENPDVCPKTSFISFPLLILSLCLCQGRLLMNFTLATKTCNKQAVGQTTASPIQGSPWLGNFLSTI